MSTIPSASPRRSTSSHRTSTSVGDAPTERATFRRSNKAAALRDYYGLKAGQTSDTPPGSSSIEIERDSEVDRPTFSAPSYVEKVLREQDLAGVLKTEALLVKEVWALDGERKALVYDNYSKLIGATDTIKKMRERMETRQMETSTLTPAIGHIAETASTLSSDLWSRAPEQSENDLTREVEQKRRDQQATVRWLLAAPERLSSLVARGQRSQAEQEWQDASSIIERWNGVRGVEELRSACLQSLKAG